MNSAASAVRSTAPSIIFDERAACALCGSTERRTHRAFRDIPVMRCSQCGFLYSGRTMADETMHAYYRDNFGSLRHMQGQMVNARTNSVMLRKVLDLSKIQTWLDIGTGYGFLLKQLKDGWKIEAEGVEISAQESDYARSKLGLPVYSDLKEVARPQGFDVVSCFEVIEHISEPKAFLNMLAGYVRPGGRLIVMTDNFESPVVKKLAGGFPKWIPHTHVSHFGPQTLRNCIHSVPGLAIEKETSYTPWDLVARRAISAFRPPPDDAAAFDLHEALSTEMARKYKFFPLRYRVNALWARLASHRGMEKGALMYAVCRKSL